MTAQFSVVDRSDKTAGNQWKAAGTARSAPMTPLAKGGNRYSKMSADGTYWYFYEDGCWGIKHLPTDAWLHDADHPLGWGWATLPDARRFTAAHTVECGTVPK